MKSGVTQAEYETLANFRYKLRDFHNFSEKEALKVGLTPQQHQALLAIKGFSEDGSITISTLAKKLQIKHHSTVGLLDRIARPVCGLSARRDRQGDRF